MHPAVEALIEREYAAQRSDEWLKLRGNMVTASDAATVLGLNPYEKVDDFILKKCGHGTFHGNEATEHGNKYEDEARDMYCAQYNEVCHEIGLHPHPTYTWLGGSPDGITESGKLVEIKCPLRRKLTPEVPVYYMPQIQLLLEILGLEEAVFIQYKPYDLTWPAPMEFVVTEVKKEPGWFDKYLPVFDDVWKRVLRHREHGVQELLPKPKPMRKTAAKKSKDFPDEFIIEDDELSESAFASVCDI